MYDQLAPLESRIFPEVEHKEKPARSKKNLRGEQIFGTYANILVSPCTRYTQPHSKRIKRAKI